VSAPSQCRWHFRSSSQGKGDCDAGEGGAEMIEEIAVNRLSARVAIRFPDPGKAGCGQTRPRLPGAEQDEQRGHPLRNCGGNRVIASVSIPQGVEEGPRSELGLRPTSAAPPISASSR